MEDHKSLVDEEGATTGAADMVTYFALRSPGRFRTGQERQAG